MTSLHQIYSDSHSVVQHARQLINLSPHTLFLIHSCSKLTLSQSNHSNDSQSICFSKQPKCRVAISLDLIFIDQILGKYMEFLTQLLYLLSLLKV